MNDVGGTERCGDRTICLELDTSSPPSGRIKWAGRQTSFEGWLGILQALESAIADLPEGEGARL